MERNWLVIRAGRLPYRRAWEWQQQLAEDIGKGLLPPVLLLMEHPHTFTFGRSGKEEHLLWDEEERNRRGVETFWVDRGGDITYHGPGQIVGYPLFPLSSGSIAAGDGAVPCLDVVGYVRRLEEALIRALRYFGVDGQRRAGMSGVWVEWNNPPEPFPTFRKVASIGVKVDARGVSLHGFALNHSTEREYWNGIVACGLDGVEMSNLADLLQPLPAMSEVEESIIRAMGEVFGLTMQKIEGIQPFDTIPKSLYTIS